MRYNCPPETMNGILQRIECPPESMRRILQKLYMSEHGSPAGAVKSQHEDVKYTIEYVYEDEPARNPADYPNLYKLYREVKAISPGIQKPAGKILQFSEYCEVAK